MSDADPTPSPASTPSASATAVAREISPSRAFLERWRLTPEGRVQDSESSDVDRVVAATIHLWPIFMSFAGPFAPLIPIVLWLAFRRRAPLVDDHGREVMNSILTLLALVCVPCVGWLALLPWIPVWLVSLVRGAIAGGSGELFRYPVVLRAIR